MAGGDQQLKLKCSVCCTGAKLDVTVTRKQFEAACEDLFTLCIDTAKAVLECVSGCVMFVTSVCNRGCETVCMLPIAKFSTRHCTPCVKLAFEAWR